MKMSSGLWDTKGETEKGRACETQVDWIGGENVEK